MSKNNHLYKGKFRKAFEGFVEMLEKEGYKLISEYTNSTTKVWLNCPFGHTLDIVPYSFKNGNRCRKCRCTKKDDKIFKVKLNGFSFEGNYDELVDWMNYEFEISKQNIANILWSDYEVSRIKEINSLKIETLNINYKRK